MASKFIDLDHWTISSGKRYINLNGYVAAAPAPPVDPATMNLRSYFKAENYNIGASTWTSSPSAGDSGSRSVSTLGSNPVIAGTINGVPCIDRPSSAGFWIRFNTFTENTGTANSGTVQPDFMHTVVLQIDGPVQGTTPYFPCSVLFNETSGLASVTLFLDSGVPTIFGSTFGGYSPYGVSKVLPAYGTPFVLQWGVISGQNAIRFNKGAWTLGTPIPPGTANVVYQNYHIGYNGSGLYPGKLGDYYGTLGVRTMQQLDDLAYAAMSKYGIT